MHVAGLWRYPVKSLAGEPLEIADVTLDGIAGDRVVHVRGPRGLLTARVRHGLVTVPASTGEDGAPLVSGHRWDSLQARVAIQEHAGHDANLVAYAGHERFDVANLLVAADGSVEAFGNDIRRLRPNVLLDDVPAGAEASWPGRAIAIGEALIGIHSLRDRCVVTSIDPDTGRRDADVFRRIRREFGGQLCLNAWVIRPGTIRLGDPASVVDTAAVPDHLGGWVVGAPYDP
jgi:MOSC domain-containing protein